MLNSGGQLVLRAALEGTKLSVGCHECNRMEIIFRMKTLFSPSTHLLSTAGDEWLVQDLVGRGPLGGILSRQTHHRELTADCFAEPACRRVNDTSQHSALLCFFPSLTGSRHSYTSLINSDEYTSEFTSMVQFPWTIFTQRFRGFWWTQSAGLVNSGKGWEGPDF